MNRSGPRAVLIALVITGLWPFVANSIPVPVPVHFTWSVWVQHLPKLATITGMEGMAIVQNGTVVQTTTQAVANTKVPAPGPGPGPLCGNAQLDLSNSCGVMLIAMGF